MNILGIDLGSWQTTALIAKKAEGGIQIVGFGTAKSGGVKKGAITNIEPASKSIEEAVNNARMMSGLDFDKVIVSISGAHAKSIDSSAVANIPGGEIEIKVIHRAIATAKQNANIPQDYEIIHVLPYNFKINDDSMDDPLGMTGIRLEVLTHIILVKKIHLKNLQKTMECLDLRIDNIVLSGYASSIACLDESERELGAILIDMGGAVCDMVAHLGISLRYNECLPLGSQNITNDLSVALHTTLQAAENVKLNYKNLNQNEMIATPMVGDDSNTNETSLEHVSLVIYSRTEETLMILAKLLSDTKYARKIGAGIVLTGGMTKLADLNQLASSIFTNHSVRVASAKRFVNNGGFKEIFEDPQNSCVIGLCLYGAGFFTPYELDSNSKMRHLGEKEEKIEEPKQENIEELFNKEAEEEYEEYEYIENEREKRPGFMKNLWDKFTNQF